MNHLDADNAARLKSAADWEKAMRPPKPSDGAFAAQTQAAAATTAAATPGGATAWHRAINPNRATAGVAAATAEAHRQQARAMHGDDPAANSFSSVPIR